MPGLIRGVARTAVIAGTATSVSNRVSRRQGQRWAQQEEQQMQQQAPAHAAAPVQPAPAPAASPPIDQLKQQKIPITLTGIAHNIHHSTSEIRASFLHSTR